MKKTSPILIWMALLPSLLISFSISHASFVNIAIPNSNFEDTFGGTTPAIIPDGTFESAHSGWATRFSNDFEIVGQGDNGAPTSFAGGTPTGQALEIRGSDDNRNITYTVTLPGDIVVGAGLNARVSFQAWSEGGATFQDTGDFRVRITRGGSNSNPINNVTVDTDTAAWILNTHSFTVLPGDRIQLRWRERNANSDVNLGLRIDDVQLLVDIIPEPGVAGAILLAFLLVGTAFRRQRTGVSQTA